MKRLLIAALVITVAACGGDDDTTGDDTTDTTISSVQAPSPDDTGVVQTPPAETTPGQTTPPTAPLEQPVPGTEDTDGTTSTAPETESETTAENQVQAVDSEFGQILADGEGNTLYVLLRDEQSESVCYDSCEATWPPLGEATAGPGANQGDLGRSERDDGTIQATYNGWPLYYYASDNEPGMVSGQGMGGVWYVIDPSGEPVQTEPAN